MKKVICVITLMLCLLPAGIFAGCSTAISECDAIRIAKEQVPARIAEAYTNSGFNQTSGPDGTWFVNFANVNVTQEEMGWIENENTIFKENDPMGLNDLPPGVYRNVVIYIDPAGNVTGRELNNTIILGPLPHECN